MAEIIDDTESFSIALTAPAPPVVPAKGEIANYDAPADAKNGERIIVSTTIKNIGGTTGDFKTQANVEASHKCTLSPGQQAVSNVYAEMPSTGTSFTVLLKCIRIT